ncbi:MAG: GNAT family N-acetyltransferase [Roseibium sp.]
MSKTCGFQIQAGFPENQRCEAARLFWLAFSGKLGKVLGPETKALSLIERLLDPGFAISAVTPGGKLLDLAGFKTADGALFGGKLRDMASVYGTFGGLWRGLLLDFLERDPEPGLLLMDGIFVAPDARGAGIGSALLDAICQRAMDDGLSRLRLDVIDTNARAQALYERCGFEPKGRHGTSFLKPIFGFSSATRMQKVLASA